MLRRHRRLCLFLAACAALWAATSLTIALTPRFQEGDGADVMVDIPEPDLTGRVLLAASGAAAAIALAAILQGSARATERPIRLTETIAVSLLFGAVVGLFFRVATARTEGANIGGGMLLLLLPVAAFAYVVHLATMVVGAADD